MLLAACGTSPQVITETLYALHQQGRMPDAVRILTTREGKDSCVAQLFGAGDGAFYRWLDDYSIDHSLIDFGPAHIKCVTRRDGSEIQDIREEEDHALFLAACMECAFELTRRTEVSVYFSLSGGRKTMSACLATAAQFYGRSQDRLFHVLITPEFESSREFYFPPREAREIDLRNRQGQLYRQSTCYAEITLISMPFVSIRDRLTPEHLRQPESPAALLASLVREEKPPLTIDLPAGKLLWKGRECDLPPSHLALYTFFARLKKGADCVGRECRGCDRCFLTQKDLWGRQSEIADLYRQIAPWDKDDARHQSGGILDLADHTFRSYRAKIRKALERAFGPEGARQLELATTGRRPETRYGLRLERERIRMVM